MSKLFEIDSLRYRYSSKKNIPFTLSIDSLVINDDSIAFLKGHNGSGKSTLLRVLAGLLAPREGKVLAYRKKIVLVHQDPYMFRGTVKKNIEYPLLSLGLSKKERERRIEESLDLVDLFSLARRQANQLSGGERKRCAIARAIAMQSEVLLLDEPDAGVDEEGIVLLKDLIKRLYFEGTGIIISSHHSEFVNGLDPVIYYLKQGKIILK